MFDFIKNKSVSGYSFKGQVAVVSGATRGIGKGITKALLARNCKVVGVYGSNEKAAEAFRKECHKYGDNLLLHRCDVSDYKEVCACFEMIEERFQHLDILVSNAGIRRDAVVAMMSPEDWHRVIDVNLTGSYNMAKSAVLLMLKKKYGRIVFITSPMSYLGFAGQGNYAASKAGQIGFAKSLAKETAKRKITVNCVSPGFIETDLISDLSRDQMAAYKKMVPMKRFGKPEEVADAVLFLASSSAAYITDSVLEINGGL
jgi:3-oxoacyl-[acyl-carrier protein] reductase